MWTLILISVIVCQWTLIGYLLRQLIPIWKERKREERIAAEMDAEIAQMEKDAPTDDLVCDKCGKKVCDPVDPCYCWMPTGDELDDLLDE